MRQHGFLDAVALALVALVLGLAGPALAQGKRALKIVALGDSLTAGYGLPAAAAFPAVLEATLKARGHDVEIVNAGVSGDTAAGGLERLDWSVGEGTHGVIVALGANDMLRGLDPAQTRKTLETIVTRLKGRNVDVLLAGMYASRNLGPDYVARFDAIYPELAKAHGVTLYPFFLDGVAGQRNLNLPDGIHPNAEGVRIIVERMLPTVERFLTRLKGA
jgi:acyl-CoA thioesterase-1